MNEKLLNKSIENFRQQLNSGFAHLKEAYKYYASDNNVRKDYFIVDFDDFYHDWAQSNWELMVERIVCGVQESLVIYGSGSDYEAASYSRVFFHSLQPSHEVICEPVNKAIDSFTNEEIDLSLYSFEGFVCLDNGRYDTSPPFNFVLLHERGVYGGGYRQVVIPLEQVIFKIKNA